MDFVRGGTAFYISPTRDITLLVGVCIDRVLAAFDIKTNRQQNLGVAPLDSVESLADRERGGGGGGGGGGGSEVVCHLTP